jgi:hypothetical protein
MHWLTFLMSGMFGANIWESCETTSGMRAWFVIVLQVFMILYLTVMNTKNFFENEIVTHRMIVA